MFYASVDFISIEEDIRKVERTIFRAVKLVMFFRFKGQILPILLIFVSLFTKDNNWYSCFDENTESCVFNYYSIARCFENMLDRIMLGHDRVAIFGKLQANLLLKFITIHLNVHGNQTRIHLADLWLIVRYKQNNLERPRKYINNSQFYLKFWPTNNDHFDKIGHSMFRENIFNRSCVENSWSNSPM